ncbi:MAG: prephenate dehydratase [Candidatus Omnitrophica bacterium]|nr:prephenate dehydratase [Candidatus Omnitrophota bacterium]
MNLPDLRKKIDLLDQKLVALLNARAEVSKAVGQYKAEHQCSIYSPARERAVYERIKRLNKGPMSNEAFEAVYREIMSSSLALEKKLKIAYFGNEGSFTHLAANKKFGTMVGYAPYASIFEVFTAVEHEECDYGVVPIENSVEGAVTHTFDLLADSELKICSQTMLKISQNLLSKAVDIKSIKKIYSHPQVFGQCRIWLYKNMSYAEQITVGSTTEAAQYALKDKHAAAIGSQFLGELQGLNVLCPNIQDIAHNTTRFLVIANEDAPATGRDRTSILFSIKDNVGALHAMLTPFSKNKINMTKIESRPSKRKAWEYLFFVDFEGHREDAKVKKALSQLEAMCNYLKILGSYPA